MSSRTQGEKPLLASELEVLIDIEAIPRKAPEGYYQTTGVSWLQPLSSLDQLEDRPGLRITSR